MTRRWRLSQARRGAPRLAAELPGGAPLQARNWLRDSQPALADEFVRWGLVWLYALKQTVDIAPALDPAGAALLSSEELAVCNASRKPRQTAAFKMQHLIAQAGPHLSVPQFQAMQDMWRQGLASAGDVGRIRNQAGPVLLTLLSRCFLLVFLVRHWAHAHAAS